MSTENLDAKGLDELERLMKDATPAPWKPCGASDGMCCCGLIWSVPADATLAVTHRLNHGDEDIHSEVNDNAHFIVAAVNAFPELLRLAREGLLARVLIENELTDQVDYAGLQTDQTTHDNEVRRRLLRELLGSLSDASTEEEPAECPLCGLTRDHVHQIP